MVHVTRCIHVTLHVALHLLNCLLLKKELKVGSGSLKEQLETPEETCLTIMLARKEGMQKLFEIFRQGENEVSLASLGEVGHTIERTGGSAVNNRDMQKKHPKSTKRRCPRSSRS